MSAIGHMLLLVTACLTSTARSLEPPAYLQKKVNESEKLCLLRMTSTPAPEDGLYCAMVWDGVDCWDYQRNGTEARQKCPDYVAGFLPHNFATRYCEADGTWFVHPVHSKNGSGWTDYSPCINRFLPVHPTFKRHMDNLRVIAKVGYSVSLVSLVVAIALMLLFKKLHCKRNTVHINLFLSFVLRALVCLVKELATVEGSFLASDVDYNQDGSMHFRQGETHWQCKLLYTLLHYALGANYMWIFVEGLYLHTLIFVAVFSQKRILKCYIAFGWLSPLTFVLTWVVVRIYLEDTLCWNTHETSFYWIMHGPIVASICVNFFFFLNIIRVLFTKLMATNTRDPRRYRKLAKSTLVLIPLFGVYYIILLCIPDPTSEATLEMTRLEQFKLYVETTINSFQGLVVALLFCFLNGEVRAEILKLWNRHRLRRTSACSRPSRTFSTTSFFTQRDRGSISHQVALVDLPAKVTFYQDEQNGGKSIVTTGSGPKEQPDQLVRVSEESLPMLES